jgi:hypothetical protein
MTQITNLRMANGSQPFPQRFPAGWPNINQGVSPFDSGYLGSAANPTPKGNDFVTLSSGVLKNLADTLFTGSTIIPLKGILCGDYTADDATYVRGADIWQLQPGLQLEMPFIPVFGGGDSALITAMDNYVDAQQALGVEEVDAVWAYWASIKMTNAALADLVGLSFGFTTTDAVIYVPDTAGFGLGQGQIPDLNKPGASEADSTIWVLKEVSANGLLTGNRPGDYRAWFEINPLAILG